MSDHDEQSPGGSKIYRHAERSEEWSAPAEGIEGGHEAVSAHMESVFGPVDGVFHEIVSDIVHLDVHHIPPSDEHPYHILFTTGMSDLPMTLPDELDVPARAELMIALPPEWKLSEEDLSDERWYWPIRQLKGIARLPHEYQTWLGHDHTIPNGDPAEPYHDGVPYCCAMLVPPLLLPDDGIELDLPNGERLSIYSLFWLTEGEMTLKLEQGADALYERLDDIDCCELLDLDRPDVGTGGAGTRS